MQPRASNAVACSNEPNATRKPRLTSRPSAVLCKNAELAKSHTSATLNVWVEARLDSYPGSVPALEPRSSRRSSTLPTTGAQGHLAAAWTLRTPAWRFYYSWRRSRRSATAPSEYRSTRVRTKATDIVHDGSRHRRHPLLRLLPRRAADADDAARERPHRDIRPRPGRGGATRQRAEQRRVLGAGPRLDAARGRDAALGRARDARRLVPGARLPHHGREPGARGLRAGIAVAGAATGAKPAADAGPRAPRPDEHAAAAGPLRAAAEEEARTPPGALAPPLLPLF